jgi:hypothetical protein
MSKATSALPSIDRQMPRPVPAPATMAISPVNRWRHDRTVATFYLNSRLRIFPLTVFGSSSIISIKRGAL